MKYRLSTLLFFVIVCFLPVQDFMVISSSQKSEVEKCGANETFSSCGSVCPKSCANMDTAVVCSKACRIGCFCASGYVRDNNENCILESDCPHTKKCGKKQVFLSCGTSCPKTCDNKDKKNFCNKKCVSGCFCADGYVRDKRNVCVEESDCPKLISKTTRSRSKISNLPIKTGNKKYKASKSTTSICDCKEATKTTPKPKGCNTVTHKPTGESKHKTCKPSRSRITFKPKLLE